MLAAKPARRAAGPPRAPADLVRTGRPGVQRRRVRRARPRGDRRLLDEGAAPDRGRGHGPVPARRADRARPEAAAGRRGCARRSSASWRRSARRACTGGCGRRRADAIHPNDRKRIVRALELERMGEQPHRESEQLWSTDLRRPAALFGIVMEREALDGAHPRARRPDARARGAVEEVETAIERGASRTARKAIGFKEIGRAPGGRHRPATRRGRCSSAATRLRQAPADLDAQASRTSRLIDRTATQRQARRRRASLAGRGSG